MLARLTIVAGLVLGIAAAGLLLGGLVVLAPETPRPSVVLPSVPPATVAPSPTVAPTATVAPTPAASLAPSSALPQAATDVGQPARPDGMVADATAWGTSGVDVTP
jgi:hypothetical protein